MEVLPGPTSEFVVASSSLDFSTPGQLDGCTCVYQSGSNGGMNMGYGIGEQHKLQVEDLSDNSSSSIGAPDDNENEASGTDAEKDEEVQSKFRAGLGSFDSLEDSLPIKRGLSSHFSGKSKSFADLSQVRQVNEVKELQKAENPFNKRRRLFIATKLAKKSFYSWSNPKSMPLLTLDEDEEEDEKVKPDSPSSSLSPSPSLSSSSSSLEEKTREDGEKQQQLKEDRLVESYHAKMRLRLRLHSFKKRGCFSLADLSEHDVHH